VRKSGSQQVSRRLLGGGAAARFLALAVVLMVIVALVGCAHVHEALPGAAEVQASADLDAAAHDTPGAGVVAQLKTIARFWSDARAQLDLALI